MFSRLPLCLSLFLFLFAFPVFYFLFLFLNPDLKLEWVQSAGRLEAMAE